MIGLLVLDHPSWWTTTGLLFKYAVIVVAVIAGALLFARSVATYFAAGSLIVVVAPLVAISLAQGPLGLFSKQPRHEQIFIYVWLSLALVELFLIWVPLFGALIRNIHSARTDAPPAAK